MMNGSTDRQKVNWDFPRIFWDQYLTFKGEDMSEGAAKPSDNQKSSKWLILGAVMLGVIMGPIDASIVNVVLGSLSGGLFSGAMDSYHLPAGDLFLHSILWPIGRYFWL